jgi:hypothetical protein
MLVQEEYYIGHSTHHGQWPYISLNKLQPLFGSGFRIRIGSRYVLAIRIRIQEGKNDPKVEKNSEFSCFEVLDVLFNF